MTPEGRVKAAISRCLKKYETLYKFMPVPSGYGPSSLDFIICFKGHFIAIEAKAPGKKPTPRQKMIIEQIIQSQGTVFVISDTDQLDPLIKELERLKNGDTRKHKA